MKQQTQCWIWMIMFAMPLVLRGQESLTPEQLLQAVHKVADLSQAGPYVLTADVVVSPDDAKREKTGHLIIQRNHDRARFEFQLGDYREIRIRVGDKTYFPAGSSLLFATQLYYFDRSWDPARGKGGSKLNDVKFSKVSNKTADGHKARCFDSQMADSKNNLCIDADHPVLLRFRAGRDNGFDFFDYAATGAYVYPRKVTITRPLMANLEVRNISVSFQPVDAGQFAIPDQAIEVETCDAIQHPAAVSTPEPSYTERARREGREGTILVYGLVTKDGSVENVEVLNPGDAGLDQNTADTVRTWKFKPGTCAGHPVATEMTIEVDFRLH